VRLIVLSSSPYGNAADARSDALLVERARRRGVATEVLGVRSLAGRVEPWVVRGDVVLPRADLRSVADLKKLKAKVRVAEREGARCLPSAAGLIAAEDKGRTSSRLFDAHVDEPHARCLRMTGGLVGEAARRTAELIAERFRFPVLVKPCVGWGGKHIVRCDNAAALGTVLFSTPSRRTEVLIQEFVEHRRTVTVLVAGGRALSAWEQRREEGAKPATCNAEAATSDAAIRAAAACRLEFASVDFLDPGEGRPLLCVDVNSMPGLWPDDPDDVAFADAIVACALRAG
jgi:glutathione synthase/RimK-type ligase-like ATP-grasp enzyme